MLLSSLTAFGYHLNSALVSGKYDISISVLKSILENDNIFDYLGRKLGNDIDIGFFTESEKDELNREWLRMADSIDMSHEKYSDSGGLSLIMSYLTESIKKRMTT